MLAGAWLGSLRATAASGVNAQEATEPPNNRMNLTKPALARWRGLGRLSGCSAYLEEVDRETV